MFTNSFVIRYIRSLSCVAVPALTLVPQICSAQTPSTIELDTVEVVQSHITKSIKSTAPAFKLSEKSSTGWESQIFPMPYIACPGSIFVTTVDSVV